MERIASSTPQVSRWRSSARSRRARSTRWGRTTYASPSRGDRPSGVTGALGLPKTSRSEVDLEAFAVRYRGRVEGLPAAAPRAPPAAVSLASGTRQDRCGHFGHRSVGGQRRVRRHRRTERHGEEHAAPCRRRAHQPGRRDRLALGAHTTGFFEIGAGLHPELSGRENVWQTARLMGVEAGGHRRRIDGLVEFTGLGEAFDRAGQALLDRDEGSARIRRCDPIPVGHPLDRRTPRRRR